MRNDICPILFTSLHIHKRVVDHFNHLQFPHTFFGAFSEPERKYTEFLRHFCLFLPLKKNIILCHAKKRKEQNKRSFVIAAQIFRKNVGSSNACSAHVSLLPVNFRNLSLISSTDAIGISDRMFQLYKLFSAFARS